MSTVHLLVLVPVTALVAILFAPCSGTQADADLVKRLGSANFRERTAATDWLMKHPCAVPALRRSLTSRDPEVATRAKFILEFHERAPVRRFQTAADNGDVDALIAELMALPKGKFEAEAWQAVSKIARTLAQLHEDKGGKKLPVTHLLGTLKQPPPMAAVERYGEPLPDATQPRSIRPGKANYRVIGRPPSPVGFNHMRLIVASGPVRLDPQFLQLGAIVFACGPVHVKSGQNLLLVSNADVVVEFDLDNSIVIAKGTVTAPNLHHLFQCRIISGESVSYYKKARLGDALITENEPNPLGFIRWSEATKRKCNSK